MKYDVAFVEDLLNQVVEGDSYYFKFWKKGRACTFEKNPVFETFIKRYLENTGVKLRRSSTGAFYYYCYDKITIVSKCWFTKPAYYYRTMLHEIAHSTANKKRLNRKTVGTVTAKSKEEKKKIKDKEELVAEISAYIIFSDIQGFDDYKKIMISYCRNHQIPIENDIESRKEIAKEVVACCDYIYEKAGGREQYSKEYVGTY